MVTELPQRTSVSGPALVRLLARLTQAQVKGPEAPLAASLSQWLGWTESIVLSTALNAAVPEAEAGAGDIAGQLEIADADYAQVRQSLHEAIQAAVAPPTPVSDLQRRQMRGAPTAQAELDFPSYRRRYTLVQQKMEGSIAGLRGRLRTQLAGRSPQMARLAAADTAMEQALVGHELRLLALIPNLLEPRFKGLAEKNLFRDDMRSVLMAELDVRLQPIEGLMCALRAE